MPNWVQQRVVAREPQILKKFLVNEDGEVDFNMAIPKPKDLEIMSGSYSYETPSRYGFFAEETKKKLQEQMPIEKEFKAIYNDTITQDEFFNKVMANEKLLKKIREFKGWSLRKTALNPYSMKKSAILEAYNCYIRGFFNLQRYGERDWYEWSITNWGTKWNASDGFVNADGSIEFQTAWSMPEPIFREISKHTPLRVVYADEDMGNNCGMEDYFYQDGESHMERIMDESMELACDTWGYSCVPAYDVDWNELGEDTEQFKEKNKDYFQIQEEIRTLMTTECLKKDFAEV